MNEIRSKRAWHPSHATVVAYLALFVALSGSAVALSLGRNSVKSKQLAPKAVKASDIAPNAVSGAKVKEDSLGSADVANLTGSDITDSSLTGADIDEASLQGLFRFGDSIPPGTTVIGGWSIFDSGAVSPVPGQTAVNLPAPAPVELTDATVNYRSSSGTDDDPACTGSGGNPTAPAGKVCIYPLAVNTNVATLSGAALTVPGNPVNRSGFRITTAAAADLAVGYGSWAYTAP
jgi:hypothetical protein